jgi:hypothetical protein
MRLRNVLPPLVLTACLACPALALAGPTWISVELPPRPWGNTAKSDPVLLVHAPHLAEHEGKLSARAEGKVGSKRRHVDLTLRPTGEADVWAVTRQWPRRGQWVLVFRATGHIPSTAIVDLRGAKLGNVGFSEFEGRTHDAVTYENIGVMSKVGAVSDREIDAMLAGAASPPPGASGPDGWRPLAFGLGATFVVLLSAGAYGPLRRRFRSGASRARAPVNDRVAPASCV